MNGPLTLSAKFIQCHQDRAYWFSRHRASNVSNAHADSERPQALLSSILKQGKRSFRSRDASPDLNQSFIALGYASPKFILQSATRATANHEFSPSHRTTGRSGDYEGQLDLHQLFPDIPPRQESRHPATLTTFPESTPGSPPLHKISEDGFRTAVEGPSRGGSDALANR